MSECDASTPVPSTPNPVSKKRELTSPEFPTDLKKNRILSISPNSTLSQSSLSESELEVTADEVVMASQNQDSATVQPDDADGNQSPLNITLGSSHMEAIAACLKGSFKQDMKDSIREELPEMVNTIIEGVVIGLNLKIEQLQLSNSRLERENAQLKLRVKNLEISVDSAEQYSRRNCLRMSGVPESDREDTDSLVMDAARAVEADLDITEIDRSHRIGKPKVGKPRDIIIKFATYRARQKIYRQRVLLKDRGYVGVFLNEDLTRARSNLLFKARQKVKAKCLKGAWSSDGTVLIKDNNDLVHKITAESDLVSYSGPRDEPGEEAMVS